MSRQPALHITYGLPACGRTVWCRQWVLEDRARRIRLDRRALEASIGGPHARPGILHAGAHHNIATYMIHKGIAVAASLGGIAVAVEADTTTYELSWLIQLGQDYGQRIAIHRWDTSPEECVRRNTQRPGSERRDPRDIWEAHRSASANEQMISSICSRADEIITHE